MGKREKEAFRNGLGLVNEQDRVLTALVSNTPLDSTHMVVVTDSLLPWEKMDGVLILGIQRLEQDTKGVVPDCCQGTTWFTCWTVFQRRSICSRA